MMGQNVTTSLDTLLHIGASVAWVLIGIYTLALFLGTLRRRGLRFAALQLFSYRVLLPFLIAFSISLLSKALVFVYPRQAAVVESIVSPGGVRPQPLFGTRGALSHILANLHHVSRTTGRGGSG